jgi:succinate semialdehyde reductase (NADPH)
MRAVVVTDYGSAPVVAEVPTPRPKAGQVLIKVSACGYESDGSRPCQR